MKRCVSLKCVTEKHFIFKNPWIFKPEFGHITLSCEPTLRSGLCQDSTLSSFLIIVVTKTIMEVSLSPRGNRSIGLCLDDNVSEWGSGLVVRIYRVSIALRPTIILGSKGLDEVGKFYIWSVTFHQLFVHRTKDPRVYRRLGGFNQFGDIRGVHPTLG